MILHKISGNDYIYMGYIDLQSTGMRFTGRGWEKVYIDETNVPLICKDFRLFKFLCSPWGSCQ